MGPEFAQLAELSLDALQLKSIRNFPLAKQVLILVPSKVPMK